MPERLSWLSIAAFIVLGCAACGHPPTVEQGPEPIDSPTLGIRLAQVPAGFRVTANQNGVLSLAPTGEGAEGEVVVRLGPVETGINLVAAVHDHQARIESLEGGTYNGARELEGPLGTVFYSRGSYTANGRRMEETVVMAIHPDGTRRLDLVYTYPAGDDSSARVTSLIGLLAEVEGLPGAE